MACAAIGRRVTLWQGPCAEFDLTAQGVMNGEEADSDSAAVA